MITDLLVQFSDFFRPHLTFISSALIATILTIYGGHLNKAIWALVGNAHFVIRTLVFVALCTFGYGAIAVYCLPIVEELFLFSGHMWLGVLIVISFAVIGYLAEKHSRKE